MTPISGNLSSAEMAERLRQTKRPILFSHTKPDGDALGALAGLQRWLQLTGSAARAFLYEPLPRRLAIIPEFSELPVWDSQAKSASDHDAIVIVDTCAYAQLEPIETLLRTSRIPRLVIDHHQTRDELADAYLIDPSASATCLMLFDMFTACPAVIDRAVASALFVGIATDTGWFRHSNTDARTHLAAAGLLERGAENAALYDLLYLQDKPERVRLLGEALKSLELFGDDRIAVQTLELAAFGRSGATSADTEDIVNEPLRISRVVVSLLLVQQPDGVIRVNFRSKPPRGGPAVDVAALARTFGGGGHQRAAGARLSESLDAARSAVIKAALAALPPND